MKYELVVFDWDGTLMNSISHIVNSLQYSMSQLDIEVLSDTRTKDVIGLGMREAIETLFPQHQSEKFIADFTRHYRDHFLDEKIKTELFPGAKSTLDALINSNISLAVATGKGRQGLDRVLRDTNLSSYFVSSRCADETKSKPHADMLLEILDELDLGADKALMIGDTVYDLEMAANAKVDSIGVTYGVHTVERLNEHGPISLINDIRDLLPVLSISNEPDQVIV